MTHGLRVDVKQATGSVASVDCVSQPAANAQQQQSWLALKTCLPGKTAPGATSQTLHTDPALGSSAYLSLLTHTLSTSVSSASYHGDTPKDDHGWVEAAGTGGMLMWAEPDCPPSVSGYCTKATLQLRALLGSWLWTWGTHHPRAAPAEGLLAPYHGMAPQVQRCARGRTGGREKETD